MLADVFSSFDSSSSISWLLSLLPISLVFLTSKLAGTDQISTLKNVLLAFIWSVVEASNGKKLSYFSAGLSVLFLVLITMNLTGMVPYVFSVTSHLLWTFPLAILTWGALLLSGWVWDMKKSSASLLPSGSPLYLAPLLVVIEVISIMIRPITLSVRLAANMSAGHLIMALMGSYMVQYNSLLVVVAGYFMFEFGICMIQAYVFVLLLALYANDHALSGTINFFLYCSKGGIAPFLGHEPNSLDLATLLFLKWVGGFGPVFGATIQRFTLGHQPKL